MSKKISSFMIFNLMLSVVAFCFILNLGVVEGSIPSGYEETTTKGIYQNPKLEDSDPSKYFKSDINSFGSITSFAYWTKGTGGSTAGLPASSGIFKSIFGFNEGAKAAKGAKINILAQGGFVDGIVSSFAWGVTAYLAVKSIGSLFGVESGKLNAISNAIGIGFTVGRGAQILAGKGKLLSGVASKLGLSPGAFGLGVGIIAAAIVFAFLYKGVDTKVVEFSCYAWDAPTKGNDCEKCNEGILPCSEYQCRSLGQACELVNPDTDEAKCVWVSKNDVEFPVITPNSDVLSDGYRYSPDNTISPPDRGVNIVNQNSDTECVGAFEPITFGITLDEPGRCRIDYLRKDSYEDMDFYFGGSSTHKYNHTQTMSLPGGNVTENGEVILQNDGNYELYVRCEDANENSNTGNFVFKYCVDPGPDTTPPIIVTTNLLDGIPIAYNQSSIELEVYVNEPAECKWSHLDQDYSEMEETMSCDNSVLEMNAQMLYTCTTMLTGLKSNQENDFYFRCKDQPLGGADERNTNSESYKFTLIGTQPLVINSVGPNETIRDSTDSIKVTLTAETSAGYDEGKANCYYSSTGEENDYILFYETDSYTHSQDLYLPSGSYEYWIKCIDLGGNSDTETTEFVVETDSAAPIVTRAYNEGSSLIIITNEDSECVYDVVNCNYLFDDGKSMSGKTKEHSTNWNTETNFYIKCRDEYGNQPDPDECNIVVRGVESF